MFYLLCGFILASFPESTFSTWAVNNFVMSGQKANGVFSESAAAGIDMAMDECKSQFQWDRWNCPKSSLSIFTENSFPTTVREVAYLNAIISAGVMYTLTLNCSNGQFNGCGCDNTKVGDNGGHDWKWGGCSDNIAFGEKISKQYIDEIETGRDARAIVNLHNNEAGRRAVKRTMKLSCKCHGVSGSCSIRTCWKELPSFKEIGDYLKKKYNRAIMVDSDNGQLRKGNSASRRDERDILQISQYDLVYLEASPDFCKNNTYYGTQGTLGRECSRPIDKSSTNRSERKSCSRLCTSCGLNVKRTLVQETTTCNCRFHWCCEVKCDSCTRIVEKITCVP